MVHDARIVPLDGRDHLPQNIRQWMGDPRGSWDGDTLVIESTNFTAKTASFNPSIAEAAGNGTTLHLTERFRLVAEDTLQYEFTVNDTHTFTSPFTAVLPMKRGDVMYEFACHEGNYGLHNILAGARRPGARGRPAVAMTPWRVRYGAALAFAALAAASPPAAYAQPAADFVPVTDAVLQDPDPADWLMWRRTLDSWGYSPLDQIDRRNVGDLRMVWSRALAPGSQQGTPLVYGGVLYMPNPRDTIQALDAATGDLLWEYRRSRPDDLHDHVYTALGEANRNIAIHGRHLIGTSADGYVYAVDATTGRLAWETQIVDYTRHPAHQTSGPIIAGGKVISGRGCLPAGGPHACFIAAHDAATGAELWRRPLIPAPGEPGGRDLGRRAVRGAHPCGRVDGAQLRPGAEHRVRRHVRELPGAEVHAGRRRQDAPVPQLDARARRRHRGDRLVLPAPQRPLGSRPPVRADPARHRRGPRPRHRELDQPPSAAGRGAQGGDRHSRQDRRSSTRSTGRPASSCGPRRPSRRTWSATSTAPPGRFPRTPSSSSPGKARRCWSARRSSRAARTGRPAPTAR